MSSGKEVSSGALSFFTSLGFSVVDDFGLNGFREGLFPNSLLRSNALLSGRSNLLNFLKTICGLSVVPDLNVAVENCWTNVETGVGSTVAPGVNLLRELFVGENLGESFSDTC